MFDLVALLVRLLAPDASPDAYNDWQLVLGSSLSDPWRVAVLVVVLASVLGSALGLGRVPGLKRWLLVGLRAAAGALVLWLVMMPAIELRAVSKVRSRVALLVDDSRSMGLATPSGTRAEVVARHIEQNRAAFTRLSKDAVLEAATFAERVLPSEPIPPVLKSEGPRTDLSRALTEVGSESSGRDLGAVIVYSDGADTEGLTTERASQLAERLGVPIYAVGFSSESAAADLAIRRVIADEFAFVHNTVNIEVELEQRGLALTQTPVSLRKGGEVVATKEVRFGPDGRGKLSFEFKPTRIGRLAYTISVPVQEGEVVTSNNTRSLVLKVIRDRIRVLQVAGRPSWDERFLRELLKRNPNVDLISFFILRTPTDLQKAAQDELALIPFPVNELFTEELPSFDIVIYQNFTYRPYRMAHYLPNLERYVQNGGAFLMIGGDQAFEDGWYAGTPISTILPVQLGSGQRYETSEYRPRLSTEGRRHPITRIGEPGEPLDAVFARLPMLAGVNPSLGLAPDAHALLVHPNLPGNPPVVAVREVGQGRTMAVTTDSLWFWRFVAVGEGGAGREFDRFWNAALRWLIRDPELSRVRLGGARSVYTLGEPVEVEAKVLGPDYRGLPDADLSARLIRVDGPDDAARQLAKRTGPDGTAILGFEGVPPGTYMLRADASHSGDNIGRAETPVVIEAADAELMAPFPRPELLKAIASASGGAYVDIGESLPTIEVRDPRRVEVDRTRRVPIWDTAPIFTLLVLLVGAEWWIRRRAGLL